MATYVVGDIQGCYFTFRKLLDEIKFDQTVDKIILLGDVINRGPHSLKMLRFVKDNSPSIEMLLGNHEIFALALYFDATKKARSHTLHELFKADDKDELMAFLRKQPLIKKSGNDVFVHAGILPTIPLSEAISQANSISTILNSDQAKRFLERYYDKTPDMLKPDLGPKKALRLALAYLTLIRMCETPDSMDLSYSGTLDNAPKRLKPWFSLRDDGDTTIYFGHWAALGFYHYKRYICLDSGCVWGNKLTAVRLSDGKIFHVQNVESSER